MKLRIPDSHKKLIQGVLVNAKNRAKRRDVKRMLTRIHRKFSEDTPVTTVKSKELMLVRFILDQILQAKEVAPEAREVYQLVADSIDKGFADDLPIDQANA